MKLKQEHIVFLKQHKSNIINIILLLLVIFLIQVNYSKSKQLGVEQSKQNINKTISDIDKKLESVRQHEMTTYRIIEEKLQKLEEARIKLHEAEKKLKSPNKERINENVKLLSIKEVNMLLRSFGYDFNIHVCQ